MSKDMKPKIGVYKFASCDGCQLAFLNAGEDLLTLSGLVDIAHFAEAGVMDDDACVDVAFIEGSISSNEDLERIQRIRKNSEYLVTLGACATAGGLQALRNLNDGNDWMSDIYANPEYIDSLTTSTPISAHIKVDLELWGCPVSGQQVLTAIRSMLFGVVPAQEHDKVCLECKRQQSVCVMVTQGMPCMGPVTRTGCGAICPRVGRDCYACFGPAENSNVESLGNRLQGLGLVSDEIARRFHFINSQAEPFLNAGNKWREHEPEL